MIFKIWLSALLIGVVGSITGLISNAPFFRRVQSVCGTLIVLCIIIGVLVAIYGIWMGL